jgi:hypothetical protein
MDGEMEEEKEEEDVGAGVSQKTQFGIWIILNIK